MNKVQHKFQHILSAALTGGVAALIVLLLLLPFWVISGFTMPYAPKIASDFVIDKTPPDNAIALQNAFGAFALPSAFYGGVMFVLMISMIAGMAYVLIKPRSRVAATAIASILAPFAVWFFFPTQTLLSLAPLLLVGPIVDRLTRRDPLITVPDPAPAMSRRQALIRLGWFGFGGLAVSVLGGLPTLLSELNGETLKRLFTFTPPAPRVSGFDTISGLSTEVTAVPDFYTMRKFATPIPAVPPDWNLTINGLVDNPLTLSLSDLMARPRTDAYITRQCVSNPVGGPLISTALMSGVPLVDLLKEVGVKAEAVELVLYGRDSYSENIPLAYALDHVLLTYAFNGVALPAAHGAPLKVEAPGLYGFKNMKWLDRIELVSTPHESVWQKEGWTKTANVKTMSRIDTIYRSQSSRSVMIAGVAFAGIRGISAVEVRVNDGEWQPAELHIPALSGQTWVQWRTETNQSGKLTMQVRATDGTGSPQIADAHPQFPDGATGYHTMTITV